MVPKQGLHRINHNVLRDFSFTKTFGSVDLPGLPIQGLGRKPLAIKNQADTSYCTGFATSTASEYQEGIVMSPEFQVAFAGKEAGAPIVNGTDPKTAMRAAIDYGSLPASSSQFSFQNGDWITPADWNKWSDTQIQLAAEYKKQGYFRVAHGWPDDYDVFDMIKIALWQGRGDNSVVMAFGKWYNSANSPVGGIVPPPDKEVSRHAYLYIDWKIINGEEYIVAHLSQGTSFGDSGLLYFSRDIINKIWGNFFYQLWSGIGLYMFRDLPPTVKKVL